MPYQDRFETYVSLEAWWNMSDELHDGVFGEHRRADAVKTATQVLVDAHRLLRTNP